MDEELSEREKMILKEEERFEKAKENYKKFWDKMNKRRFS